MSLKEIYYLLVVFPFVIYNKFILEFIVISLGPFWSDGLPEVFCPFSFIYCVLPLADNLLQYTVMAFGLRNAPATFQRLMNRVLAGIPNCDAYLDDIVVYSSDWNEHLKTLRMVFDRLQAFSLTLNLAKCEFGRATVTYLGKQVGQGEVRPIAAKVQAIVQFPVPTTKRQLRRFSWYGRILPRILQKLLWCGVTLDKFALSK